MFLYRLAAGAVELLSTVLFLQLLVTPQFCFHDEKSKTALRKEVVNGPLPHMPFLPDLAPYRIFITKTKEKIRKKKKGIGKVSKYLLLSECFF